jgi:hypothetical protein
MLSQDQINQLLTAKSSQEFRDLAKSFGYDVLLDTTSEYAESLYSKLEELEAGEQATSTAQSQFDAVIQAQEQETGQPVGAAEKAAAAEAIAKENGTDPEDLLGNLSQVPQWIMTAAGNRELTDEEQQRIVDTLNQLHGLDIISLEDPQVQRYLQTPTADAAAIVQSAIDDTPYFTSFSISLPNGGKMTVNRDQFMAAVERYSTSEENLVRVVQLADLAGMTGSYGRSGLGGAEPVVYWQPLAGLMRATGMTSVLDEKGAKADEAKDKAADYPFAQYSTLQGQISAGSAQAIQETLTGKQKPQRGLYPSLMGPKDEPGQNMPLGGRGGVFGLADDFNFALARFGDPGIALIYTLDSGLAVRVFNAGRQGNLVSPADQMRVQELAGLAGYTSTAAWREALVTAGDPRFNATSEDFLSGYLGRLEQERQMRQDGSDPETERIIQKPDPVAVQQAVKDLWRSMFLEEPDQATVDQFSSQLSSLTANLQEGESIDTGARLRAFAEGNAKYQEFYGRKPVGMSEEEYQSQFRAGQQSILGNELGENAAVKAGMRDGQYQTAVGAAAGTRQAWDNSTFLGRLAQAAQAVNENT